MLAWLNGSIKCIVVVLDTLETKAILYTHIKTALHFSMNCFGQWVQIIDYLMIKRDSPRKEWEDFFQKQQNDLLV